MFNVGGPEVLVILLVALIVLGPAQLPKAARQVGNVMNEIRKVSAGFQRELTSALEDEDDKGPRLKPQSPGGPQDVTPEVTEPPDAESVDAESDGTTDESA